MIMIMIEIHKIIKKWEVIREIDEATVTKYESSILLVTNRIFDN